ncbi:MAG: RimK/LysX family protein [Nitrosomonas sp.]|nr:MAG: RimK/LysX family protein [Nitrosomonas sp.]
MKNLYFTIGGGSLLLPLIFLMLSACNPKESSLTEREARISARESELVTLFAELIEWKRSIEKKQSEAPDEQTEAAGIADQDQCTSEGQGLSVTEMQPAVLAAEKTVLGALEHVYLDPPGLEFSARIDSGARTSSVNAMHIVEFERDGKPFVKFSMIHPQTDEVIEITRRLRRYVKIKERGDRESQRRPVVRLRVAVANINEQIDFTLENRSKFKHQVLIGRNLLSDLAVVDVSKKYTTVNTDPTESDNTN